MGTFGTWGYQLQDVDAAAIARSPHDAMVIDYTREGQTPWARAELDAMKRKPGGAQRTMLAYVSIGEAEKYRTYWRDWKPGNPSFLLRPNPEWPDNYPVKFEDPAWQAIALGMLETAQDSGFDGVYLDKVDVFDDRRMGERGAGMMAAWIIALSRHLKARRAGFLVYPQNADELLDRPEYLAAIDGIGREDLLYGEDGDGKRNKPANVADSVANLRRLARAGKPILAVEYGVPSASAVAELRALGLATLCPLVAGRELDVLPA